MATKQEWLNWVKEQRQEQAKLREFIFALEDSMRLRRPSRKDLTEKDIWIMRQKIDNLETVVQNVIATEGLPSDS